MSKSSSNAGSRRVLCHGSGIALALVACAVAGWSGSAAQEPLAAADVMNLTDEPGGWFRSQSAGTPVAVVEPGQRVDFKINDCCTSTRHTVTLVIKPEGSAVNIDQDKSQKGTLSFTPDVPGVYLLVCKIHPYMTAVVGVVDPETGQIPDVTAGALPFIGHLGLAALPAATVLSVVTTIAPTDGDKQAKWDILGPGDRRVPATPGVGEVWVNTQFERVPGQTDAGGVPKPGTVTVVDAATFTVEREINGLTANGRWNNPHNLWANFALDTVYNSNWFGSSINKIDRETGAILDGIDVGQAPTHIITIPTPGSPEQGRLTVPLSAENDVVKVEDQPGGLSVVDHAPSGEGSNHPHGHWLTCGQGDRMVVPNVFKGFGFAGSVSVLDTASGNVIAEFAHDAADPLRSALLMPIAVGECHVETETGILNKAYVANVVTGSVTVLNVGGPPSAVDQPSMIGNIPVTLTPDGQTGFGLLDTLQVPIQTPVDPEGRFVATAVLSLTTVARPLPGSGIQSADHVAIIDARTDQVVAFLPTPAGTHGVNWGAKLGGGHYAWVTSQHSNALTVIDPDPDGNGDGHDAAVVGTILLANGSTGAGVTDGTGGQGVKPLPITHDGWIQPTVALAGTGALSAEVEGWLAQLTEAQKNPVHLGPAGSISSSLRIGKLPEGKLELNWGASCLAGDTDYGVYEGVIGDFASHTSRVCSTAGATTFSLTPGALDRYYLVVPSNAQHEGSYGLNSQQQERPQGLSACHEQSIGPCP